MIKKISHKEYLEINAVSQSDLKLFNKSPRKYKYFKDNPDKCISTKCMDDGTLLHDYLLDHAEFENKYFVSNDLARKGTSAWKDLELKANGKNIIFNEQLKMLYEISGRLRDNIWAKELLESSDHEKTLLWTDENNLNCKCKIDMLSKFQMADLKKTKSIDEDYFINAINNYGYDIQAAWYIDGYYNVTGELLDEFYIIAVEIEPPYLNAVYRLSASAIERGREKYKSILNKYIVSIKNNNFEDEREGKIIEVY